MRQTCLSASIALAVVCAASVPIAAARQPDRQDASPPAHSAVTPVPRDDGVFERFELLNDRVAAQQDARLIFIGDSITHGWEGVPDIWNEFYAARSAINLGIGGDRTQHVLWRLENGNIEGLHPAVAVVMIGTNNSNGEDNTVAEIADGVRAIVARLCKELPETKILLLEIFPRGEQPNPQRGKILQVNQILRKLHDGERVHVLDIGHHFVGADGSIPPAIMPDALHLSEAGYRMWAEAMEPDLKGLLEED
jgi:beta-glucosidase